jgi:hypothetical protein
MGPSKAGAPCAVSVGAFAVARALTSCSTFVAVDPQPRDAGAVDTNEPANASDSGAPPPPNGDGGCSGEWLLMHCYYRGATGDFQTTRTACEHDGAHLVTITSTGEQRVVERLTGADRTWIGLIDDVGVSDAATFSWINGEPVTFSAWEADEPNDNASCATESEDKGWSDHPCDQVWGSICEKEP